MNVEHPAAFRFIIDDDLYLLDKDKAAAALPASLPSLTQPPVIDYKYLGEHEKNFLILVHYTDKEFMADEHLTALQNILKRMELGINDVAILNMAAYASVTFEQLVARFKPERLLLMGKKALPQNIPQLPLNRHGQAGNCRALFSFSFDEMMSSTENKKAFWEQMKLL